MPTSRRSVIKSIATVAIATPVAAQHEHHAVNEFVQISGTAAPYKPKFFRKLSSTRYVSWWISSFRELTHRGGRRGRRSNYRHRCVTQAAAAEGVAKRTDVDRR